jgi:hypothetical protein
VFWGKDGRHRYGLTTYRTVQLDAQGKPVDNAPAAGGDTKAAGAPPPGGAPGAGNTATATAGASAAGGSGSPSPFSAFGGGR